MNESVRSMLDDRAAPTASVEDFLQDYDEDESLWWRMGCGHHQNLFEEAVARMQAAEAAVSAALEHPETTEAVRKQVEETRRLLT